MGRRPDTEARHVADGVFAAAFPPGCEWVAAAVMHRRLALAGVTDWQARAACARHGIVKRRAGRRGAWLWLPEREAVLTETVPGAVVRTARRWHESAEDHAARHRETVRAHIRRPIPPTDARAGMRLGVAA
jgi:hypothetical protein